MSEVNSRPSPPNVKVVLKWASSGKNQRRDVYISIGARDEKGENQQKQMGKSIKSVEKEKRTFKIEVQQIIRFFHRF